MTSVLNVFNNALLLCKNATLATTADAVPGQADLATVYTDAVQYCLERGQWNFAKKSTSIAGSTSLAAMGYSYGYAKPSDLVRLTSISASTNYYPPEEYYEEDATNWYSNDTTIYITYTSNSASFGLNLLNWPQTFAKTVEAFLAQLIYPHIGTPVPEDIDRVKKEFETRLITSLAKDAINQTVRVLDSSKESVYQGALRLLGFRPTDRVGDETIFRRMHSMVPAQGDPEGRAGHTFGMTDQQKQITARRMLDEVYDNGVAWLVQEGVWNFANLSVAITHDPSVTPAFGFSFAFQIPNDFVRLVQISGNDIFYPQCDDYLIEGGYFHASFDPLYVIYTSNASNRGNNTGGWPRAVKRALEAYLAWEIAPYFEKSSADLVRLDAHLAKMLRDARSKDAMDKAPGKESPGRLFRSRTVWRGNAWRERR